MKRFAISLMAALCSCVTEGMPDGSGDRVRVGDAVPAFATGDFVSPSGFMGKRSLLVFFQSTCPDCRREMPVIDAACRLLPDLQTIAISRGEILDTWDYSMAYYSDPARLVYNLFAEHTIPRVYLIDDNAKIVWTATEKLPENFKQKIDEILY